ncbi:LacI family DNA-binding transcriptional regulator [Devosia sp. FJ2-5-3]|jgi:LacI family repressor for deo operon, udp, cdd, tsx, nupC, and nupG|uniref:LacI family DNA-binding transcriptional regulator n=1 Tax=Devosia sp. FJ2-5-3 TaxID=2976680 RepID=UPI0023D80851|nr:LacI family DNA-binding transcriptional regulator [Devosia sp. FJ2-5-3]WEJ57222.1 LacI family transcriptional regulator [Devosia sp. FJ2-5-3]
MEALAHVQEPRKTPTIQDVARFAKVSTATVSRALSAPGKVSEATRARVSEAVRVTGYTLNQTARSLRQRSAKAILVALPDIRNPFFSSILDAIEREAALRGYGVLVINLYFGRQTVGRLQDFLLSNRADGLLLLDGSIEVAQLQSLRDQAAMVPVVIACEEIPKSGFHTVLTDNIEAAERATRHLIDLGHTRIGHLLGPEQNIVARERHSGFARALDKVGLEVRPEWCLRGNFEMETGYAAAARFLSLPERPTAFFAANDESAIGFLSGLRQHGIICPRDISVIGFDDLGVTPHIDPPLTTMRQPREMLGRMAAEALIDMIEGSANREKPLRIVLRSELVVRESTGRPPSVERADAPALP